MEIVLSIVIANYNFGRFLGDAIRSVVDQCESGVELIVVDGGSTDESVEVIKRYSGHIAWWCSEPDHGQSDAFNKGFAHARGRYLTWLNADDVMPNGSLSAILCAMNAHPDCEWFTGNFYRFTVDGTITGIGWGPHIYPSILQRKNSPIVVFGPTSFFSRNIYEKYGKIDESFHYRMDTELWIRFIVNGVKQRRVRAFCWGFRLHEDSKTAEFGAHRLSSPVVAKMREEGDRAATKNGYKMSPLMLGLARVLRVLDGSYLKGICYRYKLCRCQLNRGCV